MEKALPEIFFTRNTDLDVEILNFSQMSDRLKQARVHNPYSPHRIQFYLIIIITEQSYTHYIDFNSYELKTGSAIFIAKNQVHNFTTQLNTSAGICIFFSSIFMEKNYSKSDDFKLNRLFNYHIESPVIPPNTTKQDSILNIGHQLYEEYNYHNNFAKSDMLRTLLHVLLLKAERTKQVHTTSKVQWLEIFKSFKNTLEKEYVKTRSSKFYASHMFISYKFLNDIVKALTGKTVKAFIDDFVTIEIKRYLVTTSLSVKEISYATGFEEPANMVKFFKKNTTITPLKFRQQQ